MNRTERLDSMTIFRWAVVAGLGLLTVGLAALAVYTVRQILVLAFVALFVAVSLDPAVRWLVRHRTPRPLAVGIIFGVAFLAVVGLLAAVIPPLVRQAGALSQDLPGYIATFTEKFQSLREFGDRYGMTTQLQNVAKNLPGVIGSNVVGFVQLAFGAVFSALTVVVLSIYFMLDLPRLRRGVVRLFPLSARGRATRMIDVTVDKVGAYMIGNVIISLVAGAATFVALTLMGASFALPLAVVVAITDLIPMIGATIGAVACVLVTLVSDELWPTAVLVAIFFVVYQQLENYVIAPRVLRNAVDLSTLAVLLAGLLGAAVLGLIGALVAIPIAAVIKVLTMPVLDDLDAAAGAESPSDASDSADAARSPVPAQPAPSTGDTRLDS
jgi:predicted PurR-regulated permease PerM